MSWRKNQPSKIGSFTVYTENDKYFAGTDQACANGFKLFHLSAHLASFTDPSMPAPVRALSRTLGRFVPPNHPDKLGLSLGHNIYTPVDIETTADQPVDLPTPASVSATCPPMPTRTPNSAPPGGSISVSCLF